MGERTGPARGAHRGEPLKPERSFGLATVESISVRPATAEDYVAAMAVVEAALLAVDAGTVRRSIAEAQVIVATSGGRVLGVVVLDGSHVEAIAVRPARRGQGIGTALIEAAAERHDRLTATFASAVRPFFAAVGFASVPLADDRWWGVR